MLLAAILFASGWLAACRVSDDITSPGGNAVLADVVDGGFHPDTVTVQRGRAVRWTNRGTLAHNVTSTSFQSGTLFPGWWFELVFDAAGTIEVHCSIHANEIGTVVIQ